MKKTELYNTVIELAEKPFQDDLTDEVNMFRITENQKHKTTYRLLVAN